MYIKRIVPLGTNKLASNLTSRDFNFEALVDSNKIYVLDKNNSLLAINNLINSYSIFTYNDNKKEYVVMTESGLFKRVNANLEEFDEFRISVRKNKIVDIFFDSLGNRYLIAEKNRIYSVDSDGNYLKNEVYNEDFYSVRVSNDCGCRTAKLIPNDFAFTAVGSDNMGKYVAYNKNNSAYLALVSENGSKVEEIFLGDDLRVNSIVFNGGIFLNATYGTEDYLYEISFAGGGIVDPIIQDIISNLNGLIDRISSTEVEIANLISAESEKVKKVVSESSDLNLILQTNVSVGQVIGGLSEIELGERDNLALVIQSIMDLEKIIRDIGNQ